MTNSGLMGRDSVLEKPESSGVSIDEDLLRSLGLDKRDVGLVEKVLDDAEDELIIEEDESDKSSHDPSQAHTKLKVYENGWVQMGMVGAGVGFIAVFLTFFLGSSFGIGGGGSEGSTTKRAKATTEAQERGFIQSPTEIESELSRVQAERNIQDQRYSAALEEQKRQQELERQISAPETDAVAESERKTESKPGLQTVAPPPEPIAPPPPAPVVVAPSAPPAPTMTWQEAQELWRLQQQIGSFHTGNSPGGNRQSIQSGPASTPNTSSSSMASLPNFPTPGETAPEASIGEDAVLDGQQTTGHAAESQTEQQKQATTSARDLSQPSNNRVLLEEQYAFLAGRIYSDEIVSRPSEPPIQVKAGTILHGRLASPVIVMEGDSQAGERPYVIELTQGLESIPNLSGKPVYLLAKAGTVSRGGHIILEGQVLIVDDKEYNLPAGYVEIRGKNGKVLIGRVLGNGSGPRTFGRTMGLAALSGIRDMAALYNRTVQTTRVTDRETIITTQVPPPNYGAAAAQGFLNEFINRANQSIQAQMSRDAARNALVWEIPVGKEVEIYFRRNLVIDQN